MTAWPCFYMFISYKNFHTSTMGGGYTKFRILFFLCGRKRERAEGNGGNARASPFPCTGAALYCIISAHVIGACERGEMADAPDLGSGTFVCGGSSPFARTKKASETMSEAFCVDALMRGCGMR